jgi:tetratricopeptide (TPR) repeat protein
VTGEQAFQLASAKGLLGMIINPKGEHTTELKVWQHQVFIEKISDPIKLHALASKLIRTGNLTDAEGVLKAAIFASQREHGPQHAFTAELNIELARVLRSQNKIEQAEWTYRRALGIYEAAPGMDMELATTAEGLGLMLMECEKAPQAVPLLEKALSVYERIPGGRPDSIARILCTLGDLRCEHGKTEEGEHLYRRASVMLEERKHADLFGVLLKMGDLSERAGKHKEALAHYNRVISAFDSWKRGKEFEVAKAAQRAAMIQLEDSKPHEAQSLLERALASYRREQAVAEVEEVDAQLIKLREENELQAKEEAQAAADTSKPAFGRNTGKRPADLPFLDMNSVKANPKATFVGPKAEPKPAEEEKPRDAEEEALAKMKAFLDSVGKDGGDSATGSSPAAAESPAPAPETPQAAAPAPAAKAPATPEPAAKPVQDTIQEPVESKSSSPVADADRFDKPIGERKADADRFDKPIGERNADADRFDKPIGERNADADRFDKPIQERGDASPDTEESGGLFSNLDSSVDGAFDNLVAAPKGDKGSDRFDKPISERTPDADRFDKPISERAEAPEAPPAPSEAPAAAEVKLDDEWTESLKNDQKSALAGLAADDEEDDDHVELNDLFAGVSSRASSAPGNPRTSLTSIPVVPPPVPPPVPPSPSEPPSAASETAPPAVSKTDSSANDEARKSFDELQPAHSLGKNLAGDISSVFNKAVLGDLEKDARFDKQISERKPDEADRSDKPVSEGKTEEADRFDKPIGERKADEAARFDKPISERSAEQDMSMVLNRSIIEQAEKNLSRFDQPISERTVEAEKTADADKTADANKLDPSRFDKPIQERGGAAAAAEDSDGMFSSGLDDSLNSAFNNLLAEPKGGGATDRFDKPIQERVPEPAAAVEPEPAPAANTEPAPAAETEPAPVAQSEPAPPEPKPAAEAEPAPEVKPAAPKPIIDLTTAKTPEELIALLEQRLEDEPTNAELWLRKGTTLAQLQRLDEAVKAFDKVTTLVPNDLKGWYCKGSTLHLKGRFEDAAYCFNYVLQLDADNVKALMRKAECLVKLGRTDQSMALYERILVLQPKFVAGWLSKARTLVQERKLEDALGCYEHVLTLEPGNEEATKAKNLIATKLGAAAGT